MLLYYITDRKGFPGSESEQCYALIRRITGAASAGVDWIQLREKDLSPRELEDLTGEALRAVRDHSAATKLLINGRTDVALACGADGVHLRGGEMAALDVRTLWIQCRDVAPLIGVSAHTATDVRDARTQRADFVVFAPIFEKVPTGSQGIGLEALREACAEADEDFGVLALGGVTVSNARSCIAVGATGVAGIRLFQHGNVAETVRRLREL
jgi:thiamine-phosphate pyrophosphorylase